MNSIHVSIKIIEICGKLDNKPKGVFNRLVLNLMYIISFVKNNINDNNA